MRILPGVRANAQLGKGKGHAMRPEIDDRDRAIIAEREQAFNAKEGPRVGDWVVFADGVHHRISYDWGDVGMPGIQTSDGGSWHLGHGHVSFSGRLFTAIPRESLTPTGETHPGKVWIFHHDCWRADNGVTAEIGFRLFRCSLTAPR